MKAIDRRAFLAGTAVAGVGLTAGTAGRAQEDAAQEFASYKIGPHIWVRCAGKAFASYRAHVTQKYPYIYPVAGPATGLSLTTESGDPYPHHRSVIFACDRVNGANYWQAGLDKGRVISRGPTVDEPAGERVVITDACDWRVGEGPVDFTDSREITFSAPSPDLRLIEADITLTAGRDVQILTNNHSLFAVRAAPELTPKGGGTLVNSEGQELEKGTFGQKARWCTYWGERLGVTEGIALLDHPENPWSPCTWFTRDYGFISPTPMQWLPEEGMRLAAGDARRMRYLVVGYVGTAEEAGLEGVYEGWATG